MTRTLRLLGAAACAALLAACQAQAPVLSSRVEASLAEAGFRKFAEPDADGDVFFICETRCGALTVIGLGSRNVGRAPSGGTYEDVLRAGGADAKDVMRALKTLSLGEDVGAPTAVRADRASASVSFSVRARDGSKEGGHALARFRGERADYLVVYSENLATARRYLRAQWLP